MVVFELVRGRKSEGDILVRVWSYGEIWSLEHFLRFAKILFDSEQANYPISMGYKGAALLLSALTELAFGRSVEKVLEDYGLKRKSGPKVHIVEKFEAKPSKPQLGVNGE